MRMTSRVNLPPVPAVADPQLRAYLVALDAALQRAFQDIYIDLSLGNGTLTGFTADPTTATLDNHQIALRTDAGNEALCARIGALILKAALT